VSDAARLQARKEELLEITAAQRRELQTDMQAIAREVGRVDGWLTLARRVTPVVVAGLGVASVLAGPARVMRLLRGAVVPAVLLRQFFSGRR
jgi:hypothetical protein